MTRLGFQVTRSLLFIGVILSAASCTGVSHEPAAQPGALPDAPTARAVLVPRSEQFDLRSDAGRDYRISIAAPQGDPPPSGYPVFYVLDANAMFLTAVEAVRFQRGLVPAIVVGIGYPSDVTLDVQRRYWDFTPPTPDEHIRASGTEARARPEQTGGEDEFLRFIVQRVRPEIERRFPVDRDRQAIFGHSLAGRFVLHVMFRQPDVFNDYIAASPSIWWDDRSILRERDTFIASHRNDPQRRGPNLLVLTAEFEEKPPAGTSPARVEFFRIARMGENAREMVESLNAAGLPDVKASWIEFAGENHGSVVPPAISRAVRFAFTATVSSPPRSSR